MAPAPDPAPHSLSRRLIGVVGLSVALFVLVMSVAVVREVQAAQTAVEQAEGQRIQAVAATLATHLDGEVHERMARTLAARDAVTDWGAVPDELALQRRVLNDALIANEIGTPIYTLRLRDEFRAQVEAAPGQSHADAMAFVLTTSEEPYWKHAYQYKPQMARALFEGESSTAPLYEDAHGTWISAYAPVRDADGAVVALLEVDASLEHLLAQVAGRAIQDALIGAGLTASGFVVVALLIARLTRGLRTLVAAARRFASGDYDTPIESVGGVFEVALLSDALELARLQIRGQLAAEHEGNARLATALERAEEATRTKSEFLANMSHELRTPLNAIIGYSEILVEEMADEEVVGFVSDVTHIHNAGRHLLGLINNILDIAKVEAGKMEVSSEDFAAGTLLQDVLNTVVPIVATNRNRLVVDADDLGTLHGDGTKLRQCLLNLLSNAAKFTEDGEIHLTVRAIREGKEELAVFTVRDTGIGMEPDHVEDLFAPFAQGSSSTMRRYGGTGLGLTLVRRYMELMGGTVSARSASGEGSTFELRLPMRSDRPATGAAVAPGRGEVVLVIDDDAAVRDLLSRFLAQDGWRVVTASDGPQGLAVAREMRPSAIVLDIMMPEMDGWTVLKALKSDADLAGIPVVVASIIDDRPQGFLLGASDYLVKPILRSALHECLARYRNGGGRVLVVDDVEEVRDITRRTLERDGWEVFVACDGRQALQCLDVVQPDVVLLDLMMPSMDGFGFLEEVRQTEAWADLPVIVVTAMELSDVEHRQLRRTVQDVMHKGTHTQTDVLANVRAAVAAAVA